MAAEKVMTHFFGCLDHDRFRH